MSSPISFPRPVFGLLKRGEYNDSDFFFLTFRSITPKGKFCLCLVFCLPRNTLTACVCYGPTASKKPPRPRIKFSAAPSDGESEEDDDQDENQSAVKFADKPLKSKPKAIFADTTRPKVGVFNGEQW